MYQAVHRIKIKGGIKVEKAKRCIKTIAGALGYGVAGSVMMIAEIGPEWLAWLAVAGASAAIACAIDRALTPERGNWHG